MWPDSHRHTAGGKTDARMDGQPDEKGQHDNGTKAQTRTSRQCCISEASESELLLLLNEEGL